MLWCCSLGRGETSILIQSKASAEKIWAPYFKRLKINSMMLHSEMVCFILKSTSLKENKPMQYTSVGNQAVLQDVSLWVRWIDMAEITLPINFIWEENQTVLQFFRLSSAAMILLTIPIQSSLKVQWSPVIRETWMILMDHHCLSSPLKS